MIQELYLLRNDPRIHICLVAFIIGFNAWQMVPAQHFEDIPDYTDTILTHVTECSPDSLAISNGVIHRGPIKWWTHCASWYWFDKNPRVIASVLDIAVMPAFYIMARRITKDGFVSVLALAAFTLNPFWMQWKSVTTYDNIWTLFLFLSIALLYQKKMQVFSIPLFVLSVLSKSLAVAYLPMFLYTIWSSPNTRKTKTILTIVLGIISVLGGIIILPNIVTFVGNDVHFRPERMEDAAVSDFGALWEITPFMLGLVGVNAMFQSKDKIPGRKFVGVWMLGILAVTPLIVLFSEHMMYSYRFIPFTGFVAILIGMTPVQIGRCIIQWKLNPKVKTMPKK